MVEIQGATEIETDLQKVSEAKSTVDEAKGATLGSISSMVAAINQKIKMRQDQLVPKASAGGRAWGECRWSFWNWFLFLYFFLY